MELTRCRIASGGAILVSGGSVVFNITSSTFTNNTATSLGGAVYNAAMNGTLTGCTFARNNAATGGAVYQAGTSFTRVQNCAFTSNAGTVSLTCTKLGTDAICLPSAEGGRYAAAGTSVSEIFTRHLSAIPRLYVVYQRMRRQHANSYVFDGVASNGGGVSVTGPLTMRNCYFLKNSARTA